MFYYTLSISFKFNMDLWQKLLFWVIWTFNILSAFKNSQGVKELCTERFDINVLRNLLNLLLQ